MWWLLLSLLAAISWGGGSVLMKKSYENIPPITTVLIDALLGIIILVPIALFAHAQFLLPLLPAAIFVSAAYMFYYYAINHGKVSLVSVAESTYPLFVLILAAIFLGETTTPLAKFGALIIVAGLIGLSIKNPRDIFSQSSLSWLWWGGTSAILAGFADFTAKIMIDRSSAPSWVLSTTIAWLIVALVLAPFQRKKIIFPRTKSMVYTIAGATIMIFGYLFFYLALSAGPISLVTPTSASYGAFTLLFAITWLKEKISPQQIVAAVVIVAGVIMVSVG